VGSLKEGGFPPSDFPSFFPLRTSAFVPTSRSWQSDTLFRMAIRTELSLRLPNSPGALAGVCRLLSDERVGIIAMALDSAGHLRLVVDNHVHGGAVLREHH